MTAQEREDILQAAGDILSFASRIVASAEEGRAHDIDHWQKAIRGKLDVIEERLAPHGRHDSCGRPLDEDGECPAWCDQ